MGTESRSNGLLSALPRSKQFEVTAAVSTVIEDLSRNGLTRMEAAAAVADAADEYIMLLAARLKHDSRASMDDDT